MDARSDTLTSSHESAGPRSLIDHAELRTILSSLSHELCRPLVSLRMGFDLLLSDSARPISSDQRGHVQTMVVLCEDLLRLTRSYLDYAALIQGSRPLSFGSYTTGALIREIDRQFALIAGNRQIVWSCRVDDGEVVVSTDASRCQQILGNLVSNALKYTPEGGDVRVEGRVEGDSWVVTVGDDGPGIPAEHLERVFEPFYRLPRDEQSRAEGNGLGLAICREMVTQLGGSIEIRSTMGVGTLARVSFPLSRPGLSSVKA